MRDNEYLSRRERQHEIFMNAALSGKTSVEIKFYSSDAKYWNKRGISSYDIESSQAHFKQHYTMTFDYPQLLTNYDANAYISGISNELPKNLLFGEQLYLIAKKVEVEKEKIS